jgi:hypothetical protein
MKKLNKKNVTALLIRLQNECCLGANALATQAMKDFGLRREHQKQTGNPDSAYKRVKL